MHLTCSDWQEGLVHFVNAHIIDLVDSHNIAIASQQRQHPQGCPWQQAPIQCLDNTYLFTAIPALAEHKMPAHFNTQQACEERCCAA